MKPIICIPIVCLYHQQKGSQFLRINSLLHLRNILLLDMALDLCGCHG